MSTTPTPVSDTPTRVTHTPLAYEENARFHRHFFDWRHRILTQHFAIQAALAAVSVWCIDPKNEPISYAAPVPLLLAFIASLSLLALDRRNKKIIDCCHHSGVQLGESLRISSGFYSSFSSLEETKYTYTRVLQGIFCFTAIVDFVAMVSLCVVVYL